MTGLTSVSGGYDPAVKNYFSGVLQDRERAYYCYNLFGQTRPLKSKNSKTEIFRKNEAIDDTPVRLQEGVTPAYTSISKFDIEIEVEQFGKVVAFTDVLEITDDSEAANDTAENLSETMFGMLDKVTRNTLEATASQIDCDGGSNNNSPTEITVGDVDDMVDYLMGNDGRKFTPMIPASTGIGTSPVDAAFWAIIHTDLRRDFRALDSWIKKREYPSQDALQSEEGALDDVRVCSTTNGIKSSDATPVYGVMFFARNGYAMVTIDEVSTELIMKPLGAGEDPLNQRHTMGFKTMFGSGIVEDKWVGNLRCTRST